VLHSGMISKLVSTGIIDRGVLNPRITEQNTAYFYGTGYILYPCFKNYFLNFFFQGSINWLD